MVVRCRDIPQASVLELVLAIMSYQEHGAAAPVKDLPVLDHSPVLQEKQADSIDVVNEKASYGSQSSLEHGQDGEDGKIVNGERVIVDGNDVSRYLLTTRDDGDPAITFRSVVLGTVFAGLGAAMCQVSWRISSV